MSNNYESVRNLAIVAHVDHGKTTLLDSMLKQSGALRDNQEVVERMMDSNDLERERGITILAKCTAITWRSHKINVIDTPGHADFGGEVERVLSMADGVLMLVDASEGPMPQTKFVLSKALKANLLRAKINSQVKVLNLGGEVVESGRLTKLLSFSGLKRIPVDEASAGDIIAVAGLEKASVSDSIVDISASVPISSTPVDPPTMAVTIGVNDSPLAGTEGTKLTSTVIKNRLLSEAETNVAITVKEGERSDFYEVGGRGELQLGVLIETMRREGFELSVSRPRVLFKKEGSAVLEPIEEVVIDVDEEYSGVIMEKLSFRKGDMQDMSPSGKGRVRMVFLIPSRGLIGYHGEFLTDSRGTGIMNRLFHGYAPHKGDIPGRVNGVLISTGQGEAVAYAIFNLQDRGAMFIKPQDKVYMGMVVGLHNRGNDIEVNVLKGKQLTNIRAAGSDEAVRLVPPQLMTLEEMIGFINDDELVECTPKSLRLRKRFLDPNERKRLSRSKNTA
ncbi:hypothetical protein GH714_042743 [Hevea brasiliensis]|uniref:Tr-type G domain-containing protein n=1 Tax=Hevea brasiliensis TaxID=3981 RepID=A0A6A6K3E5_HEVBR|nr:hypothetical protein GH714_042743 [Hevea brasiliensis]